MGTFCESLKSESASIQCINEDRKPLRYPTCRVILTKLEISATKPKLITDISATRSREESRKSIKPPTPSLRLQQAASTYLDR